MPGPVNTCFSLVRGRALRVTRLDGCGNTLAGSWSSIVTDGFISVGFSAQTDTGTAISVTNAAGAVCIIDTPCPVFTGYDVSIDFCGVNPVLIALLTGQPWVLDGADAMVGFRMNSAINACDSGFALELWSNVPTAACDANAAVQYGYFLLPFLKGGVLGDFTIGNDAVNFTLTGAQTKDGSNWGVGPYDVVTDVADAPSPLLTPIATTDHLHMQLTELAPPNAACAPVQVGIKATGATAGTPGVWTGGYPRWDLADVAALTATPGTAWTVGQKVITASGEAIKYNGTAWVHTT